MNGFWEQTELLKSRMASTRFHLFRPYTGNILHMHLASRPLGGTSRKLDSESNWKAQQNDNFIVRISMHIMHAYRRSYAYDLHNNTLLLS